MSFYNRVAWTEGMFLRPQHFQQQDRFFCHRQRRLQRQLHAYAWGITLAEVDPALLLLGQIGFTSIEAVLPDGVPYNAPAVDSLPEPFRVPEGTKDKLLCLAVPIERSAGLNLAAAGAESVTRYIFQDHEITDETLGGDAREILQLAQLSVTLKLESDDLSGYISMPLVRVKEISDDGEVKLDPRYIPPCLNIQNIPEIKRMLKEIEAVLKQRAEATAARLSQGQGTASSIADFLMLQLLNRYQPLMTHLVKANGTHPEQFFRELVAMIGELSTFCQANKRVPTLPEYQHEQLTSVLGSCYLLLSQSLSSVIEQTAVHLPLEARKFGIRVAAVADRQLFERAVFVLAVKADVAVEELRARLPAQIKVGPVERIRDLVNNQLPGISVAVLPVAPRQVPYHAGYHYFQLEKNNSYWTQLKDSGGVAVHLSGQYPALEMELWAINQSS